MDTNFYDVIVCGGETAGCVAGGAAGAARVSRLLLGHEPRRLRSTPAG